MGVQQVLAGYKAQQFVLNLDHVFAWRQAGAIADAEYVCVHGHGHLTKCRVENHVGGFASDTR